MHANDPGDLEWTLLQQRDGRVDATLADARREQAYRRWGKSASVRKIPRGRVEREETMEGEKPLTLDFSDITLDDLARVGGKNASAW